MKQYCPEAEMCLEVNLNNINNNETKEDISMDIESITTTVENKTATTATPTKGVSVSFDWKNIYNNAKEHLANGYAKGKTWAKEHPKHTAIGLGVLALAALLKIRSKKSDNKK